jgi:hypothetical protein
MAGVQGGGEHSGVVLLFTNHGSRCTLTGYPGVDGLNARGKKVVSARRTRRGYLGGLSGHDARPRTVSLRHGSSASAVLEGYGAAVSGRGRCARYRFIAVTAPNTMHTERFTTEPLCYPEIHPVVAGLTGRGM